MISTECGEVAKEIVEREETMQTRQEAIQYCHSFQDVYEDYPFHDDNWCVMRHKKNKKTFALIYDKDGYVWINVKCDPEWREFWRNAFESVVRLITGTKHTGRRGTTMDLLQIKISGE